MRGFSLIELLVVIAIIGIIAAFAYPAYTEQARKGKRSDGQAMLEQVRSQLERYYYDNNTYTDKLSDLSAYTTNKITSPEGHYEVSLVAADADCPVASCYQIQAEPKGGQVADGLMTLDSRGRKTRNGKTGWN